MLFFIASFQEMYQTTQPFDPEGVLGTVNSIVMGFPGMQVKEISSYFFVVSILAVESHIRECKHGSP